MIAIVNESTACTDAEVQGWVSALQTQVRRDFGPRWGFSAELEFMAPPEAAPHWQLVVLDNADQAGALGYHDVTQNDLPLAKVFAATTKQYGGLVSVTASHELLEMLGDPQINMTVAVEDANGNVSALYAYEACDACEDDQYAYEIDGVPVSDFVLPSWFDPLAKAKAFDLKGHVETPLQLLPGGYIGRWTPSGGWSQVTNGQLEYKHLPNVGSRRERRARGRRNWLRSAPVHA